MSGPAEGQHAGDARNPAPSEPLLGPEERILAQGLWQEPRKAFRADLRARFLAGSGAGNADRPSQPEAGARTSGRLPGGPSVPLPVRPTDDIHNPEHPEAPRPDASRGETLSPGELRLAQVLGQPGGARPEWREAQRRAFLGGAIERAARPARTHAEPAQLPALAPRPRRAATTPRTAAHTTAHTTARPRRRRLQLVASGLAIAAALFLLLRPVAEDPRWELGGDFDTVAVQNAALRDGVLHQDQTAQLDCTQRTASLRLGRHVMVEMVPGTVARFCPPRSQGGVLEVPIELVSGELLVHLDPRLGPTRLVVQTSESVVNLTGTSLSILREASGTCVCVASGSVRIDVKGQERPPLDIDGGSSAFLFASGAAPRVLRGEERMGFFGGESHWLAHESHLTQSVSAWEAMRAVGGE